ncbi:1-aminocyclopropane-1-carboxylate deaminase/D-cysteine desulfhydrase [Maribacter sp. 2304DJ31-5]|uniref:1-aminocyclopropane-1-carboxylate deaminase/D-cysteine desulfhydrase n=1 Tax=Maribacter sp. 2304DJ31-5 TaxID=3386273 RepID=UPI0039BCD2A7
MHSKNQYVTLPLLAKKKITLAIKREDLIHPLISGNKYRKLKYNIAKAKKEGYGTLLTFGGAYSNHIVATAAAGKENGFKTVGVIRGEELENNWHTNPTLKLAHEQGMLFRFVSRTAYRNKESDYFISDLKNEFKNFYLIPEGGTNALAIKGCEEILSTADSEFDMVCASTGTGGTLAGLINSSYKHQQVMGFSALKGEFLKEQVNSFVDKNNWKLNTEYHIGGYGKITRELVLFINDFKSKTGIPLDPVYTGKMVFGLLDMVKNDSFVPETKILAVHTGGLQGVAGMNATLKKKNLPLLHV